MHDGYMYHGYMHDGYMHHGYMHHEYMHHGYMRHGYKHHQQSESRIHALWTPESWTHLRGSHDQRTQRMMSSRPEDF